MYTIEAVEELLSQIVDDIPEVFLKELNGGINLLEECKQHPESRGNLYIMGEYCRGRGLGRLIRLYYGSFMRVYAHAPEALLRQKLRESVLHELTHHLESLAGERGLELQDQIDLAQYRHAPEKNG